jgi:hypothetical protein
MRPGTRAPGLLLLISGSTLFALAGALPVTTLPLLLGAVVLLAIERRHLTACWLPPLDLALIATLFAVLAQLVPLAPALRARLSPSAARIDQALSLDAELPARPGTSQTLSLDPAATLAALILAMALVAFFWGARSVFGREGVRRVTRGVGLMGLVLSIFAALQHATAPRSMYWVWQLSDPGARPFGPFVNRNHLATWLIMAIPLVIGYVIAHVEVRRQRLSDPNDPDALPEPLYFRDRLLAAAGVSDPTLVWMVVAVAAMSGTLVLTLSRSGLFGAAAGVVWLLWLADRRMDAKARKGLLIGLAALATVAFAFVSTEALAGRTTETLLLGTDGRGAIWRETWPMVRDFWRTGVGAGAYARAMLVYQQSTRLVFFNYAHDEYLQIFAEGGLLVAVPAALAAVAGVLVIGRRLKLDRSPMFWIRAGAAGGLLAVAAQSVWDQGLRLPANAILFALMAAVATCERRFS